MLLQTLTTALLLSAAAAIPDVKVIPLRNDACISWPGWIQSPPGMTGGLQFLISSAEDAEVNDLPSMSQKFTYSSGQSTEHIVMTLHKSRSFAKEIFRCYNGSVAPWGRGGGSKLSIAKDAGNAFLTYDDGYEVQVYGHEIAGVRQEGVYLGALNQTTWGFYYQPSAECGKDGFYQARLLGLPDDPETEAKASADIWFKGFLKVVEYW